MQLSGISTDVHHAEFDESLWHDALDQLRLGEMPPESSPQPTPTELRQMLEWITSLLDAAEEVRRYADGRVSMRRLTRYEYANTLRDLLGVDLDFARELPPEPASPDGFLNDGATLEMSPTQFEIYLATARRGLEAAIVNGERPDVFRYQAGETAIGKLPRRREGGHTPVNPEFVLDVPEFPREGEFRLRIRAGAIVPEGEGFPRLRVSLGNIPGIVHVPRRLAGEVEVSAPVEFPQTYEFRGRMEDFPQPGDREFGNVDFKGMIALIDFVDADGRELRYRDRRYSDPPPDKKKPNPKMVGDPGREPPEGGPRYDIVIESVEFVAPFFASWPPPSHVALLGPTANEAPALDPSSSSDQDASKTGIERDAVSHSGAEVRRARETLQRFMALAFRRPVAKEEVEEMVALFSGLRSHFDSFPETMVETLAAVLVSPHFLYIVERRSAGEAGSGLEATSAPVPLNDHELATRLSYFLWSTAPDDRLRELAAAGVLSRPKVLRRQTERLLDDPRFEEFVNHFADQWFELAALERVAVNPEFYPEFDPALKAEMRAETRAFLGRIVRENRTALELIESDWTMANRALANHYGLAVRPRGSRFEPVPLDAHERRGGILGQGAFLLSQSDGQRPHPIKRAVWIRDRLLDDPPAPPPADVPELDPEQPDLAKLSLKRQLELHREQESCRGCHEGIDPWGIPLEHFDAVGRWRLNTPVRIEQNRKAAKDAAADVGPAVDATTVLPDGTEIGDAKELKRYLIQEQSERFARAVVKRLASYALGRSLDVGDRREVERLSEEFVANELKFRDLIFSLVQSELFLAQ